MWVALGIRAPKQAKKGEGMPQAELLKKFGVGLSEDHSGRSFSIVSEDPASDNIRKAIKEISREVCTFHNLHHGLAVRMATWEGKPVCLSGYRLKLAEKERAAGRIR